MGLFNKFTEWVGQRKDGSERTVAGKLWRGLLGGAVAVKAPVVLGGAGAAELLGIGGPGSPSGSNLQVSGGVQVGKATNLAWLPFAIVGGIVVVMLAFFRKPKKRR